MKKFKFYLIIAGVIAFTIFFSPSAANASTGGSDSVTPYIVGSESLVLAPGDTFQDGGHVNIKFIPEGGTEQSAGIHFESLNNQPSGVFIGLNELAWKNIIHYKKYCITWVQVSNYNQHFGEGGQQPVCNYSETPVVPEVPVETPSPDPTQPVEPTPEPSETPIVPQLPEQPSVPETPSETITELPEEQSVVAEPVVLENEKTDKIIPTGQGDWLYYVLMFGIIILAIGLFLLNETVKKWGK